MRWRLPAATHETIIGLLAATGMRVGEALKLDRSDVDWDEGVLLIRESKFGKSRQVPVLPCTLAALERYGEVRDQLCKRPTTASFFVSDAGHQDDLRGGAGGLQAPVHGDQDRRRIGPPAAYP